MLEGAGGSDKLIAAMVRLIRPDVIDTGTSNRPSPQLVHGQLRELSPRRRGVNGVFSGILTSLPSTSDNLFGCKNLRQTNVNYSSGKKYASRSQGELALAGGPPAPFSSRSLLGRHRT